MADLPILFSATSMRRFWSKVDHSDDQYRGAGDVLKEVTSALNQLKGVK